MSFLILSSDTSRPVPVAMPTLYDPVPGNIGLIGDSAILLHLEEPDGVLPADAAGGLANLGTVGTAPTSAESFCGRGRSFGSGQALAAADLVSGSTLELRDVTVQAILSWNLTSQAGLGAPGTIIARGKGGSSSEYVSYALQLQVLDLSGRVGLVSFWWQDSAGAVHLEGAGEFVLPTDTDFFLLTATRRWESTTSVVCRYYVADQLLEEFTSSDGDIAGATAGTTTIGTAYSSGTPGAFLCGVIDELRVVDYEMSADEVRATWQRLSIHQPNGVAMFAGLTPPGSRWARNPDSNIGRMVKIAGELLGLVIARTEELRANWLPDQAYTDFITRWESVCGLVAKPRDSLDTRRARVIAYLSRTRGYSIPALQQAFSGVFDLDVDDVQILQYSNLITDSFDSLNTQRWLIGTSGIWSDAGLGAGSVQVLASSGSDIRWDPTRAPCYIRTPFPNSSLRNSPFGPSAVVAQCKLASITSLAVNSIVGLFLHNRVTNDAIWFGVKNVAGTNAIGYQIFSGLVLGSFVSLLSPAPSLPIWFRVRPQTKQDATANLIFGYSTTGPSSGFTESSVVTTGIVPQWAGLAAMSTDASLAANVQASFDDFLLEAFNGDRPFSWYAFRDPTLSGAADIAGAQQVALTAKPAHTFAAVCQNLSVLCDDARDGLCDRGPLGGL